MSNVIEDCLGPVDRVVISSGHIVEHDLPMDQWPLRYFVDYIEAGADGGTIVMWNGISHDKAIVAARRTSRDWGDLPIIDLTEGELP